ncbi:MAG: hypothetical protein AVDCRST_MAG90-556 [uncultured Microvirga sp.]|uniref:Uncharacterized protein n=1 Tax=uncultured Microvirga sp. TaxID=412392 RepID=A0A6J4KVJ3_9HYPH|nr:MAG: hypothetical protein AVDCRST_MAG90-556 [uncultured Microvirga sp.]
MPGAWPVSARLVAIMRAGKPGLAPVQRGRSGGFSRPTPC